eukprot:CAMPEP_0202694908 /NCGR_PEP_ID=MMETSP1385-20130828/8643_1 /ASSEMBLY_ACC=CAM_ASM_000861 /TAXON_ID=933848 /ORGANISM="Elphidium margaritaceum" /LENGTH=500 /DNA_ID=CAMNT_0049350843 /DNA_START=23 /DNA_END=1525 /DNA_ORIENTATION=-
MSTTRLNTLISIPLCVYALLFIAVLRASQIQDCCCDTETVSTHNQEFLNEILTVIRQRTFFRIFKVDIYKPCKLWPDNTLCFKPTCSVQECCDADIPQKWKDMEVANNQQYNIQVDLFVSDTFEHWHNIDEDQWVSYSGNQDQMVYVDLVRNADGYTGYKGEEAGKIWRAVYEAKNLLYLNIDAADRHLYQREDRVLFRLISGFHTLTTCMVFANWPLPHQPHKYGPNLELYEKVLHDHQDWIENLYFDFVFLLRAVNKASHVLSAYDMNTGNPSDDAMTHGLMNYLLRTDFVQTQCSHLHSFDESTMFQEERLLIMDNFKNVFRNISDIMDCVGCEKCKLHAKLELLGLGTALKILFTKDVLSVDMFERNEILALMVTLGKYSDAITFIEDMEQQLKLKKLKQNMHGYVDIDNEWEQQQQTQATHDDTSTEAAEMNATGDESDGFDVLIYQTFAALFLGEKVDACQQWKRFCESKETIEEQTMVAQNICNLYAEFCPKI